MKPILNPCGKLECDCEDCWIQFCKQTHDRFAKLYMNHGLSKDPLDLNIYGEDKPDNRTEQVPAQKRP